ncbi:hypothetical protein HTZ84_09490 [Haloterrigena sp. SYSU A558-1]|uniref:Uncharacterized protein n=1 Tax=Haloterrigena gelatinilytica TaxID=2741724 RepID=A0ABX2LAX5_9EURY|nr:hypothetical protein [Haloterrigena gelatinilytica]NUC72538.1 hypothetical protein [Haloterrigena gelatinilytica]
MTCEHGGATVHFLVSGLEFDVFDLSTESEKTRYSHARLTIPDEGGKEIARNAKDAEPVEIRISGTVQNRYLYPEESLEINRENARLRLYDARKILERGVLSEHFGEVNVGEVTDYIFENRDDPYDVLTGIKAVNNALLEEEKQDAQEDIVEAISGSGSDAARSGWKGAINDGLAITADFLGRAGKHAGMPHNTYKGLEFDDISPNSALKMVEDEFGFSSWVDNDGVLWLGLPAMKPKNRHAVSGLPTDKAYCMKEYNVVRLKNHPVSVVKVNGETHWFGGNTDGKIWNGGDPSQELYPMAEAWIEDEDGEVAPGKIITTDEPLKIWDLDSLEDAARNMLISESANHRNGNIIFNGMASEQKKKLAQMSVGDIIMVADYIEDHCNNAANGGSYIVTSVQHSFSITRGWIITVEVSSIPKSLKTMAVYYSPTSDEGYKSLKSYRRARRGED